MSMGRWVFLFIPEAIFSAAFSGGVCVQVLCHRGGGDGLQSHADEEEGLYLASIYLSISASNEKRSNWKQLLKPTYDQGEAEEDCGEENWMARGEFSFGWRKTGTMQGKQSVRRISKILRKNTDYWNFDYAENGRTFWGVRLWCLTGEISAWSNFGVSSVGHLQFPCQTLPGHFGASSQTHRVHFWQQKVQHLVSSCNCSSDWPRFSVLGVTPHSGEAIFVSIFIPSYWNIISIFHFWKRKSDGKDKMKANQIRRKSAGVKLLEN